MKRRSRRCPYLGALAGLALLAPTEAAACDVWRPFVTVRFAGRQDADFERAVVADLAAGLLRSDVSVCPPEPAVPLPAAASQLAELDVEQRGRQLVALKVRLRAASSESRLERELDLSQVPGDSRAFAVALAADELLRAGGMDWLDNGVAEPVGIPTLAVAPASAEVELLLDGASETGAAAARWSVGLRPALERFAGGQTLWGADAAVLVPLSARVALQLAPGVRSGALVDAPQGQIESSALTLAANARYCLMDTPWQLAAGLGLYGARLTLEGASPRPGATVSRFSGLALYGQTLLSVSVPIAGPLRFELSGALGLPLRELEATADGRIATAASGLQLGVGSALWLQL